MAARSVCCPQERDREAASGPRVALKETCRVRSDRTIPLWPLHHRRLASGGCSKAVLEVVDAAVECALAGYAGPLTSRIRLTAIVAADGTPRVAIERRLSSLDVVDGIRAVIVPVDAAPVLPPGAAKPADRSLWDSAHRTARDAGGDQAILVGPGGVVLDGSTASVFLRTGTRLTTPPAPPAVAGVLRQWIIQHADELGFGVTTAPFTTLELDAAEEVFFTNAFGGAREMRGRGGDACRAVNAALARGWGGRGPRSLP